jgi:hypothetical protein
MKRTTLTVLAMVLGTTYGLAASDTRGPSSILPNALQWAA